MELTCIVVDDEPLAVKLLESLIKRTHELKLIASFTDSIEAINYIKEKRPDLIFLDIQMPDVNGMELAKMLPNNTRIIFTTAFKEYAFESYEVNALDFLLKPIRYSKFLNTIEKAKEWFSSKKVLENSQNFSSHEISDDKANSIFIKVDGEYRQIELNNLLYVSGMKDYVMFHLKNERRPYITYLRMNAAEEMLPKDKFMRVHRSYIVALDKIQKIDRNNCIYLCDEVIHVTDAYIDQFKKYLLKRINNM